MAERRGWRRVPALLLAVALGMAATTARPDEAEPALAHPAALTASERQMAAVAWRYFQVNIDPGTGLANATNRYPSTTMWELGSFLSALVAAQRLGLMAPREFEQRMGLALDSLARLPLFEGLLPNKAYNVRTLAMVDYNNKPSARGLGWSAIDLGRLLNVLHIIDRRYPVFRPRIATILGRWSLKDLAGGGDMYGAALIDGEVRKRQEGRFGYQQYAARGAQWAGLDVSIALSPSGHRRWVAVEATDIPVDDRPRERYGALVIATSEPYLLYALELGLDGAMLDDARRIYRAQQQRFARTGLLTAVSEGHLDRAPVFAYATVYGDQTPWAVVSFNGQRHDEARTLSTKAAVGWHALFHTPYTTRLTAAIQALASADSGWQEGLYEADQTPNHAVTCNSNAMILEALHYRMFGPLLPQNRP